MAGVGEPPAADNSTVIEDGLVPQVGDAQEVSIERVEAVYRYKSNRNTQKVWLTASQKNRSQNHTGFLDALLYLLSYPFQCWPRSNHE